jgi:hypothetical protein
VRGTYAFSSIRIANFVEKCLRAIGRGLALNTLASRLSNERGNSMKYHTYPHQPRGKSELAVMLLCGRVLPSKGVRLQHLHDAAVLRSVDRRCLSEPACLEELLGALMVCESDTGYR